MAKGVLGPPKFKNPCIKTTVQKTSHVFLVTARCSGHTGEVEWGEAEDIPTLADQPLGLNEGAASSIYRTDQPQSWRLSHSPTMFQHRLGPWNPSPPHFS